MIACQTLWSTAPVLLNSSTRSPVPLGTDIVHSDCSRIYSSATSRTAKCQSRYNLGADLWGTSRAAEASALVCGLLGALFPQQQLLEFPNQMAICLPNSALLQPQALLHHNMARILCLSIMICTSGPVVQWRLLE
jgi:hypothetical protein